MKYIPFNINDCVMVKLTDHGRALHRREWDKLGTGISYMPPKENADGWSKWQLWRLIELYGNHIGVICDMPFATSIMFCVEDDKA